MANTNIVQFRQFRTELDRLPGLAHSIMQTCIAGTRKAEASCSCTCDDDVVNAIILLSNPESEGDHDDDEY